MALVAVGTAVLIVPPLVIVDKVPPRVLAVPILRVPPEVVVNVPFTTKLPPALFELLVLSSFR